MVNKQEIIIRYFREGDSVRKINRDLGINRETINRYLADYISAKKQSEIIGNSEVLQINLTQIPQYPLGTVRPRRKLTPAVIKLLEGYLAENDRKIKEGLGKQRMLRKDMHEAVLAQGHSLSYTSVCEFIKLSLFRAKEAFIRQEYVPGSVCEFDWAEAKLVIGGIRQRVYMALFTSAYSNYRYGFVYHRQDSLAFMESHRAFFEHLGGVYPEMVYDNMRVAVAQFVGRTEKRPTKTLQNLSGWYHYRWRFCNVCKGNEKGHVERSVEMVRRKAFAGSDTFATIQEANLRIQEACEKLNGLPGSNGGDTPLMKLAIERKGLFPHPGMMECFLSEDFKIDKYATFSFGTNRYSVPDRLVGCRVSVKIYSESLRVYEGNTYLFTHLRSYERFHWNINIDHYLQTLSRKPGALAGSVALRQAPELLGQLYRLYFTEQTKEFLDLLTYSRDYSISPERIYEVTLEVEKLCPQDIRVEKVLAILGNRTPEKEPPFSYGIIESLAVEHLGEMAALMNMN